MKKSNQKIKAGWGGSRLGSGGGGRWKHGRTKLVRLPVALLDEILEVARYMDEHEGMLPVFASPVITSGHPLQSLSAEQIKKSIAKQKAQDLAQKVMRGDDEVLISDKSL